MSAIHVLAFTGARGGVRETRERPGSLGSAEPFRQLEAEDQERDREDDEQRSHDQQSPLHRFAH
jgi:hypothetical protein